MNLTVYDIAHFRHCHASIGVLGKFFPSVSMDIFSASTTDLFHLRTRQLAHLISSGLFPSVDYQCAALLQSAGHSTMTKGERLIDTT